MRKVVIFLALLAVLLLSLWKSGGEYKPFHSETKSAQKKVA